MKGKKEAKLDWDFFHFHSIYQNKPATDRLRYFSRRDPVRIGIFHEKPLDLIVP